MSSSLSEITSLQETLNSALDAYKAELVAQQLSEPSLLTSVPHPMDHITFLPSPALFEARKIALASLGRLKLTIQPAYDTLVSDGLGCTAIPACIRLTADIGLPDILSDAPDPERGLSISEIAEITDVDGRKLERILRLLVTQGWFREPKEGYFANSRLSNIIKKNAPGFHLATYLNELQHKVSLSLPAMITHPDREFRMSDDERKTAFQLAHNTDLPAMGPNGWYSNRPEDAKRFALAMGAAGPLTTPGVLADFPWVAVAKGKAGIVDVGGGQGTLCCSLAAKYPELSTFIVQDLAQMKPSADAYISSRGLSDRVQFEEHDFFTPQPRKGSYLFVLQRVLHDWSNAKGAEIIKPIRDVLDKNSCILIIDTIIEPSVVSTSHGPDFKESFARIKNNDIYTSVPPPPFIPADFGEPNKIKHGANVLLTTTCNAFERTRTQMEELVELAGMKIKQLHATRGGASITEVVLK